MTLLEKAKAAPVGRHRGDIGITAEVIELAIAWAKDEIGYSQILAALYSEKKGTMQAYITLSRALREAFRRGLIDEIKR